SSEATPVHHAARWRGGNVAARGAGAAAGDADDWSAPRRRTQAVTSSRRGIPSRTRRPVNLPDVRFTSNSYRALALQRNNVMCQSTKSLRDSPLRGGLTASTVPRREIVG